MRKASIMFAVIIIALALAAGVMVAACGSSSSSSGSSASSSAAATGDIVVGHIVNLTGPEAMVGKGQQTALDTAFKTLGPINGRTVKVITVDAKGTSADAVNAARQLVEQNHVVAIFGPTEIGQKMAVGNYLKTAGVPDLIYNPSPIMAFQGNKWIVGVGGGTDQCPTVMGDYLYQNGSKSMNTLTEDSSAGRAFFDPMTKVFTQEGGKVLKQQWVPETATDFSPYLTSLPAADTLAAWEPGDAGIKLFTQWYQLGIYKKMPIAAPFHGGFTDGFVIAALPKPVSAAVVSTGTLSAQTYDPASTSASNKQMQAALTPILGFPPSDDGFSGPWQAAVLFEAGVTKANGDTSPDALLTGLLGSSIDGPQGPTSFASGQQFATQNVYVQKVIAVPNSGNKAFTFETIKTYENVPPDGFTPGQ